MKRTDKPTIRLHMRRFRALTVRGTNRQITYLHIYLGMSIQQIASVTGIARKTTERLLLGQQPTEEQLRTLKTAVRTATKELEKLVQHHAPSRTGMYHSEITLHLVHLGRSLCRSELKEIKR